jgi:paraquat-inducible protein B
MAELPDVLARPGRGRVSIIWLIPAVAALIGGWMAFRAFTERGPAVVITFQSGEGLEAGQTRIKVRSVEIGKVRTIALSPDLSQVRVTADLNQSAAGLLSEHSRFWIVRARISTAGISAMGTLISGAYIGFDPGEPRPRGTRPPLAFVGLETPPTLAIHQPGRVLVLRAARLGSLNIGSPVHFRQIKVGEVMGFDLDPDGRSLSVRVFIHAPYDALVTTDTRFWDAGGVQVSVDANGVRLRSESIVDLMIGGISFENPVRLDLGRAPSAGQVFTLYPDLDRIREEPDQEIRHYVAVFQDSVRGLSRGAPVEFRGVKVGQVEDFALEFTKEDPEGSLPVLLALEPARLVPPQRPPASPDRIMEQLVEQGLRAQLKAGSLLTGSLFVELVRQPTAKRRSLGHHGTWLEIPALPQSLGTLVDRLTRFAGRLEKLPVEEVVAEVRSNLPVLQATLERTRILVTRLDGETAPQAEAALRQTQATLAALEKVLRSDSPAQGDLHAALEELTRAARAVKDLADTLERHPEALLRGKGKDP